MNNQNNFHKIKMGSLYLVGLCMLILLTYLGYGQKDEVIHMRESEGYRIVENVEYREVEDATASSGIRKEYLLHLDETEENDRYIACYLIHHYVRVYIGEELVYSLMPDPNTLSETAGCRWIMIPVSPEDAGKTMRVETFPAYKSVVNTGTEFLEGSRYAILLARFKMDLPEVALGMFAFLVGAGFILIGLFCLLKKKSEDSLIFLGIFSVCLGAWKAADTKVSAMLFPEHALALSVIPLGMLSLLLPFFLLYIQRQVERKRRKELGLVCAASVIVMALQIILQVTGVRDLRETLVLTHCVMAMTILCVIWEVIGEWRERRQNKRAGIILLCFLLCVLGAAGDLICYYKSEASSGMLLTIGIFVVYILIMGIMEIMKLTHQANIDFSTGLFNKSRCSELVNDDTVVEDGTCLIMFDLNQLKKVNDTRGHQDGDEMIYCFAEVLKRNIPSSAFIGRYGGDEFLAVLKESSREKVEGIMKQISDAVEAHNRIDTPIKLSYASGCVFSEDHPGKTMSQLLKEADHNMYQDKKEYYRKMEN